MAKLVNATDRESVAAMLGGSIPPPDTASLAQLEEQCIRNAQVVGPSPTGGRL